MRYKKKLATKHLGIRIIANSKQVIQLVDNYLDFKKGEVSKPKIIINFFIHENLVEDAKDHTNFIYSGWLCKGANLLSSLGSRIAQVTVNPKAKLVEATIFNYQESIKERILDFILFQPLRLILGHYGLFSLHASAVEKGGACVLVSGGQNCGKSTLAFILAQNGFKFIADDDSFVKLERNRVFLFPFPTKMGLKDNVFNNHPNLKRYIVKNYRYGDKKRFSLKHMYDLNNDKGYKCKMILFPKYCTGKNICMTRISKEDALARLIKENIPSYYLKENKKLYIQNFWTLYALTRETKCFELRYNDKALERIPRVIQSIF